MRLRNNKPRKNFFVIHSFSSDINCPENTSAIVGLSVSLAAVFIILIVIVICLLRRLRQTGEYRYVIVIPMTGEYHYTIIAPRGVIILMEVMVHQ